MTIHWKFKKYLAREHNIYTVTELQKLIVKKTGYIISVANLCKYVNARPTMLRLETVEIICSALNCKLSHLVSVGPKNFKNTKRKKLSYKNTPKEKIGIKSFPDPENYIK